MRAFTSFKMSFSLRIYARGLYLDVYKRQIQGKPVEGGAFEESHAAGAAGGSQDTIQPQKFQTLIPAVQHQYIHHASAAVGTGIFPFSANADGRFLASGSLDHRIAGVEVELDFLALLVEGPASDLRIAGWVYIEALAPGPGISLQLQPVSYTHLDVYKRQVLLQPLGPVCFESRLGLDVCNTPHSGIYAETEVVIISCLLYTSS